MGGSSLEKADLKGASLKGAKMKGVNLSGADLGGAIWEDGQNCIGGSVGKCIKK